MVTGLSGAGMSSALKVLEDCGYEVLDNFPLNLIIPLLDNDSDKPIAIGIDTRTRNFNPKSLQEAVNTYNAQLLFVDCSEKELQRRYNETRRKHPLAKDRTVTDGIQQERALLEPLKKSADFLVNTTDLSIHDLRRYIEGEFSLNASQSLKICALSFGFKNGIPREADIVMDVRFLKNPHWEESLRPLTGQNDAVAKYIEQDESLNEFFNNFKNLIEPLLYKYQEEGKHYLTIAIGCTGGKHRSVFVTEKLAKWLKELNQTVHIKHRDMPV